MTNCFGHTHTQNLLTSLPPAGPNAVYIRRLGVQDIRLIKTKYLDSLGENAVDAARASKGGGMERLEAYNMALQG